MSPTLKNFEAAEAGLEKLKQGRPASSQSETSQMPESDATRMAEGDSGHAPGETYIFANAGFEADGTPAPLFFRIRGEESAVAAAVPVLQNFRLNLGIEQGFSDANRIVERARDRADGADIHDVSPVTVSDQPSTGGGQ